MNKTHEEAVSAPHHPRQLSGFIPARLASIVAGLITAWLLLEIVVRILAPDLPPRLQGAIRDVRLSPLAQTPILPPMLWRPDNYFGYVSRPGAVDEVQTPASSVSFHVTTLNWLDPKSHVGFRVDSPDWQPRWPVDAVAVGSSFTFCFTEYADCWVRRLETDHGLSVVNLAQIATGSVSHLRILKTFGLPYQPRFVIWQWYGLDFNDDYGLGILSGDVPPGKSSGPQPSPWTDSPLGRDLSTTSAVYKIITTAAMPRPDLDGYFDQYRVVDHGLNIAFGRPVDLASYDMAAPKQQYGWKKTQASLLATRDLLAKNNARLLVILVPTKEEVYRRWTEPLLGHAQWVKLTEGRLVLDHFCASEHLACLDVTSIFQPYADRGEQIYLSDDFHINEAGNRILSDAVWEFMQANGLQ